MRYFLDTEFIEDGKTIDLISIGIVAEDGRNLYLQNIECDFSKASQWVQDNVFTHLDDFDLGTNKPILDGVTFWYSREDIKLSIISFIGTDQPQFWAYYADYDWVVFCQLIGAMIDLPESWPKFCRDLKQLAKQLGNPNLHELVDPSIDEHNALADAEWNLYVFKELQLLYSEGKLEWEPFA